MCSDIPVMKQPSMHVSLEEMSSGLAPVVPIPSTVNWPAPASGAPYKPLYVRDDPTLIKYFKLRSMGMPDEQIKLKMRAEEIDSDLLDRPDEVSPNDPGVRCKVYREVVDDGLQVELICVSRPVL